jgi:pimeloyl-ACP methyl ester carboxylesterase/DNA-binding CsgD family transcriptional regulator
MTSSDTSIHFCRSHDGVQLAYCATGRGPLLIKAATWLSHLQHDGQSPVWQHLLQALGERHKLLRYDERGCGLSDRDVDGFGVEAWVADLEAVADCAGAEHFALLGISQGAPIAIAYAVRHPERVTHLVLHGGYARGRLVRATDAREAEEAETMAKLAEIGWGRSDEAFRQFFTSQFIPGGTQEQQHWFNELESLSTSGANAARFMRAFNAIDVTALLPQVRCPTLVLHSRHDARVPFAEGRLIAGAIPGASFVPIDSRNHLLLADEPGWAQWLAAVRAFLPGSTTGHAVIDSLTPRQRELLELMAQGRDNAQIAATLGVAEKTVRNHISAVFAGLQVESRAQAIVLAREAGLGRSG